MGGTSLHRCTVTGVLALAALACLLAVAAPAGAASPFTTGIGGYSLGTGTPLAPGAPRIPYTNHRFLAGSPDVGKLKVRKIRGGPKSGRVLVRVRVRYPHLKPLAARLLSDRAKYRGRARITLRGRATGKRVRVSDEKAVPLGAAAQGGRVTHEVLLSRHKSRRLEGSKRRLKARVRAVAGFNQFGGGKVEDKAGARSKRRVALGRMRGDALKVGAPSPWACAGPADIPYKGFGPGVHALYAGGTLRTQWSSPIRIRLCKASDRHFDRRDWYALNGFDGDFPDSTTHGQLGHLRVKQGYVTVTWTPNRGPFQDVSDRFEIAVNGTGEHSKEQEVWDFRLAQAPFTMRAMGDSITAGYGYAFNGRPIQVSGSDRDFDFARLLECAPPDNLNDRCSSNSGKGPDDESENGRWYRDTGLSNNVAWPAQFANRHGVPLDVAGFATYRNWAVSGSAPEDWIRGAGGNGKFGDQIDEIVRTDPDLTVLTIGANPILGEMLKKSGASGYHCGGNPDQSPSQAAHAADDCISYRLNRYDVYGRLRAIYRKLLDAPHNHIVVAPYPVVYPPLQFEAATTLFVNAYPAFVAERMGQDMNAEIRRAVDDENARAERAGQGHRLFMMSPKRFNLGYESYDQKVNGGDSMRCPTYDGLNFRVDGPSNQSAATQSAQYHLLCPDPNWQDTYLESMDGAHMTPYGAGQYANALDGMVSQMGVPVDGRTDYAAEKVKQTGPPALEPGGSGTATIVFRNQGTKTLYRNGPNPTRCRVSHPRNGQSEWLDPNRENTVFDASGQPIGVKMDQDQADPGDDFTCTFHVIAPDKPYGVYPEYFSPVAEGKAWLLPHDDVSLPFSIANETHVVYPSSAYSSVFVRQEGPFAALAPGETSKLRFTFRNTGTATLFNKGDNPTNCRPSNPRDRQSPWVDKAVPIDQNRVAPGDGFSCTIPIKAPAKYGSYNEYFSPVTEGKAWMFNNGFDDVYWALDVADPDHAFWPFNAYAASWVSQDYPHETLHPGQTGTVTFTFRNAGRPTLYNKGPNATYCRPSNPRGRESLWVKEPTPIDQSRVGRGELFTCTITVTAPSQPGTYNEYFSPWTKGKDWMFNNGHDDVFVPLKSG